MTMPSTPTDVALAVRILGTGSVLPGRPRTTADIAHALSLPKPGTWEARTGISTRYWADPGTLVAPLAAEALRYALEAAGLPAGALRRIILVHSGVADRSFPATANAVAATLGLSGSCDAFDLNNACMGFLSGFDVAARSVATGLGPVGVVSAELTSRAIRPSDRRPYLVFGDAVGAVILGPANPGDGVLAAAYGNDGTLPADVVGEHSTLTGKQEFIQFRKTSEEILGIALSAMSKSVSTVLAEAGLAMSDVEWVLPHQPNGVMLQRMVETLGIDPARMVEVVSEIGSVASASIPVSLDRLMRSRPVCAGDRILMAGVGAGVSHGAVLYQVGRG